MPKLYPAPPPFPSDPSRSIANAVDRMRAYFTYSSMSRDQIAQLAGISNFPLREMDDPTKWNPSLDTLRKVEAVVPRDFDPRKAVGEYRDSIVRARVWIDLCGIPRPKLKPLYGILSEWIQDIDEPDWSPSWYALRKMLAVVPPEFDHNHPPVPIRRAVAPPASDRKPRAPRKRRRKGKRYAKRTPTETTG